MWRTRIIKKFLKAFKEEGEVANDTLDDIKDELIRHNDLMAEIKVILEDIVVESFKP